MLGTDEQTEQRRLKSFQQKSGEEEKEGELRHIDLIQWWENRVKELVKLEDDQRMWIKNRKKKERKGGEDEEQPREMEGKEKWKRGGNRKRCV